MHILIHIPVGLSKLFGPSSALLLLLPLQLQHHSEVLYTQNTAVVSCGVGMPRPSTLVLAVVADIARGGVYRILGLDQRGKRPSGFCPMLSNMALGLYYQRLVEFGLTAIVVNEIGSSQLTRRILGGVIRLMVG